MSKLSIASPEIDSLVQEVASEMGLSQIGIEFQTFNVRKAKEVVKISKASEITELMSKREDLVIVIVYEAAFDLVDDKTKHMWIRMALEPVSFDSEKDRINIGCPMITVPLSFAEKYKEEAINSAKLGLYTISQLDDMEKQRKEAEKAAKKNKKKGDN